MGEWGAVSIGVSLLVLPLNESFAFLSRSSEDSGVGRTEGSAQKAATLNSQLCQRQPLWGVGGPWRYSGGGQLGSQELSQQVR